MITQGGVLNNRISAAGATTAFRVATESRVI